MQFHQPNGQLTAAVEIKNRENLTASVATDLRRNLAESGLLPEAPYFLIISQDRGFVWKDVNPDSVDAPPTVEFPMHEVIARYVPAGMHGRRLRGDELRWLILNWLGPLASATISPEGEAEKALAALGFFKAIRGATSSMVMV